MSIVDRSRAKVKEARKASGTTSSTSHSRVATPKSTPFSSIQRSASTSPPPLGPSTQFNSVTYQNRRAASREVSSVHHLQSFSGDDGNEEDDSEKISPFRAPRLIRSVSINDGVSPHELSPDQHVTRPHAVRSVSGSTGEMEGQQDKDTARNAGNSFATMEATVDIAPLRASTSSHDIGPADCDSQDVKLRSLMQKMTLQGSLKPSGLSVTDLPSPHGAGSHPFVNSMAIAQHEHVKSSVPHEHPYAALHPPGHPQMFHNGTDIGHPSFSHDQRNRRPGDPPTKYHGGHGFPPSQSPMTQSLGGQSGQAHLVESYSHSADVDAMEPKTIHSEQLPFQQDVPIREWHPDQRRLMANSFLVSADPLLAMGSNMQIPGALQSQPQSSHPEHGAFDPRHGTPVSPSTMLNFVGPPPVFDQNAFTGARSNIHAHPSQQPFVPYPGLYRGPFPLQSGSQGTAEYGVPNPSMMPALPPPNFAYHERHPSVTTQGSVTPPFTPSSWQPHQMGNAPFLPQAAAWQLTMPEAQTQQWRGTPKGGSKMQHRRMQSTGIAYPAITPFMSPQLPFASDRRVGSSSVGMHTRSSSSLSYASLLGTSTASQDAMPNRSPLLEEFRALHNRGKTYELKDIRGAVVEFSTDQHGSRFTQDRLIGATKEMIEMVFDEILPAVEMLMVDVFGNYVVQKIIEHGTPEMRHTLLERMKDKTRELSFSTYGCRVVQRMLDCVDQPGRMQIANELKDHVETFVCDQNANHVVQKILERSTPISDVDFIAHVFHGNVKRLASHCYSCRVLQRIFEYCEDSEKRPLMVEMLGVIGDLMKDRYGNYVVQWVLREGQSQDKHDVVASIKGDMLALSTAKCASNVVEKAIECSSPQDRFDLIEEIMRPIHGDDDGQYTPLVLDLMMKDQYGNYVLQCCLNHASEEQRRRLLAVSQRALIRLRHASGSGSNARHLNAIQRLLDAKGTN